MKVICESAAVCSESACPHHQTHVFDAEAGSGCLREFCGLTRLPAECVLPNQRFSPVLARKMLEMAQGGSVARRIVSIANQRIHLSVFPEKDSATHSATHSATQEEQIWVVIRRKHGEPSREVVETCRRLFFGELLDQWAVEEASWMGCRLLKVSLLLLKASLSIIPTAPGEEPKCAKGIQS